MKAFLIDPKAQTITEVSYSGAYTEIYKHIEADLFDVVTVNREGDGIFVDDEGLLKEQEFFFLHKGYPSPLAGRGLVLGTNREGESVSPKMTIEDLRNDVLFLTRDDLLMMQAVNARLVRN